MKTLVSLLITLKKMRVDLIDSSQNITPIEKNPKETRVELVCCGRMNSCSKNFTTLDFFYKQLRILSRTRAA